MTDEQINERIALLCGWKHHHMRPSETERHQKKWRYLSDLPNYAADLNACHEFEKTLDHINEWFYYEKALAEITDGYIFHATARQRCEAFLRVHNQWEEQP